MRKNGCRTEVTTGIVFFALIFILSIGDAMASECVRCHTKKDQLKAITDTLPEKIKSAEISGQG